MIVTALIVLLVLLAASIPVAASIGLLGVVLDKMYSFLPVTRAMGEVSWSSSHEFLLVSIPLFILLGELLLRSGYAERMYDALTVWLNWLPGGLTTPTSLPAVCLRRPVAPAWRHQPRSVRLRCRRHASMDTTSGCLSVRWLPVALWGF